MIEHTPEDWQVTQIKVRLGTHYEVVHYPCADNDPDCVTFVADCGANDDSEAHAQSIVADHKAAPNAPHECADPQCPGNINRRKLAAFDGLLAACEAVTAFFESKPCIPADIYPTLEQISAAIAKAEGGGA